MKRLMAVCFVALMATTALAANYDPLATPPAPVLNMGWFYDQVNQQDPVPSVDSPYVLNLASPAIFRITDDFIQGDTLNVSDFGAPLLVTADWTAQAPTGWADPAGWLGAGWAKGETLLAPGPHSLVVTGNIVGGLPAGFYTQLASPVPVPGAVLLGAVGLSCAGCRLRRRRAS